MIPTKKAHLGIAAGTDAGRKGKNNEDQYAVAALTSTRPKKSRWYLPSLQTGSADTGQER